MSRWKNLLRRATPLRASVFKEYREDEKRLLNELRRFEEYRFTELEREIAGIAGLVSGLSEEVGKFQINSDEKMMEIKQDASARFSDIHRKLDKIRNSGQEIVWAQVFNQTIRGSEWLHDASLSPGRWAVGYPFLYALYRTLDELRPKSILELGLGQSTTLIAQYAASFDDISHTVVEHDESWISFYSETHELPGSTTVQRLELCMLPHEEMTIPCDHDVRAYENFSSVLERGPFDLVVVDGPFGYDMRDMARIDVLALAPEALCDSFAIMIDDYNRSGEKGMARALRSQLESAGIRYAEGVYGGEKESLLLCSRDVSFLASL